MFATVCHHSALLSSLPPLLECSTSLPVSPALPDSWCLTITGCQMISGDQTDKSSVRPSDLSLPSDFSNLKLEGAERAVVTPAVVHLLARVGGDSQSCSSASAGLLLVRRWRAGTVVWGFYSGNRTCLNNQNSRLFGWL